MTDSKTIIIPDFKKHLFRCSGLGRIMSGISFGLTANQQKEFDGFDLRYKCEGRPLTEKQSAKHAELLLKKTSLPELSKGVKTECEKIFRESVFKRRKEIYTKQMDKGNFNEEDTTTLISKRLKFPFFKNEKTFENDWIKGTPDNLQGKVRDWKTSWDLYTFPLYNDEPPSTDNEWQILGYQWLTGLTKERGEVIYALTDTPEHLINDEKRKLLWRLNEMDLTEEQEKDVDFHMTFRDIPAVLKTRIFYVEYDENKIEAIKKQVGMCRDYMIGLGVELQSRLNETVEPYRRPV